MNFNPILVLREAVDDPELTGRALLVGVALIRHADGNGECFPGVASLARKLGCGRHTVIRAIAELERSGWIRVDRQHGRRSVYRFRPATGATAEPIAHQNHTSSQLLPHRFPAATTVVAPQNPKVPKKVPILRVVDPDFADFWKVYPKKVAKRDALKAWRQVAAERPPLGEILDKLEELKVAHAWTKDDGQFVPHPASWLRDGGWDDEPGVGTRSPANDRGPLSAADLPKG